MQAEQETPQARKRFRLRPYQREAIRGFFRDLANGHRKQLVVLPTGTGKTTTFGMIARIVTRRGLTPGSGPGRVLVIAHRGELLSQAAAELDGLGVPSVLEKAEARARGTSLLDARTVVGSVQTLQGKRLAEWPRDEFDLIVIDEGHHAPAASYRKIMDHFNSACVLLVTATPERADEETIGVHLTHHYRLTQAIADGFLVPVNIRQCETKVDLTGIKTTAGDFNLEELERKISEEIEPLARGAKNAIGDRTTIVFTPDVGSARAFADMLNDHLGVSARAVWGSSPKHGPCKERDQILADFRDAKFQVLCNCALLTEGYNLPRVSAIVLARPTKRPGLQMQMIGRGTRLHSASGKVDCEVLDYAWVVKKGGLESPVGLFAEIGDTPDILAEAAELIASGAFPNPIEALVEARRLKAERLAEAERKRIAKELAASELAAKLKAQEEERRQRARKKAEEAEQRRALRVTARNRTAVKFSARTFDPVGAAGVKLQNEGHSPSRDRPPLSPDLARKLVELGVDDFAKLDESAARRVASYWADRKEAGMATLKQVRFATRQGYRADEALDLTNREAQIVITRAMHKTSAG